MNMQFVRHEKIVFSQSESQYDYYAEDDIVSLYFNSADYLSEMKEGESKAIHAVGIKGNKREKGAVAITKLAESFSISIDEEIFEEGGGTLYVTQDADVFPRHVQMKNLMFFGNVEGKRIYETLSLR